MNSPQVSIVLPVRNGEKYISESIQSLLSQTFSEFECIVIDDGSTDATLGILKKISDPRIRIFSNEKSEGIAAALNFGIKKSTTNIIVRMDADDWAYPQRLEIQFNFMKQHPEVAICGTFIEEYETGIVHTCPSDNASIRTALLFNSSFFHPTVVFRKNIILQKAGGYDVLRVPAEDYDLWVRLSAYDDVLFANIPQVLLRYRMHPDVPRDKYRQKQCSQANKIRCMMLDTLGLLSHQEECVSHNLLFSSGIGISMSQFLACAQWVRKIYHTRLPSFYSQQLVREKISHLWFHFCRDNAPRLWCTGFVFLYVGIAPLSPIKILYWTMRMVGSFVKHSIIKKII